MTQTITIDCRYLGLEQFAAAYLVVNDGDVALVDNNTNQSVPLIKQAIAAAGLALEQVRYLIVTHVHLDHAGATSTMAGLCPNATVLAHPRAARHIIDPEKLIRSAASVYGQAEFERLYGKIEPVASERVRTLEDEEGLEFGQGRLRFLHTRGHANHHFCIVDESSASMFTGDAFGLHYPALQKLGPFAFPSTSPTDFDGPLARAAVRRIVGVGPEQVYPTHFGEVRAIEPTAAQLIRHLDFSEQLMLEAEASDLPDDRLERWIEPRLRAYFAGLFDGRGGQRSDPDTWALVDLDIQLNAQGLAFAAAKRRRKAAESSA